MFENLNDNIARIGDKIVEYVEYRFEYYKLLSYKSLMKMTRSLFFVLLYGAIIFLVFFFVSLGLAYLIGNSLGNIAYGYFIMGGFYIIVLALVALFGKRIIERIVLLKTSEWFIDDVSNQKLKK